MSSSPRPPAPRRFGWFVCLACLDAAQARVGVDDATRELMTRFDTNLWVKRHSPLKGLRQAPLSILDDPDFGDGGNPWLWAAWTLSGDPGGPPKPGPPAAPDSETRK